MAFVWFALGLVCLVAGAEALVQGASRLALSVGTSPLVIGLTVVAFGTSAPELAVSVGAAMHGNPEMAMGNVVGSNVFNIFLILGLSALIAPLAISVQLIRIDVPILGVVTAVLLWVCFDGSVGRLEGTILVLGGIAYTVLQIRGGTTDAQAEEIGESTRGSRDRGKGRNLLLVGSGLALLILGSRWLLVGATTVARAWGVSELIIGLTLVAAGTSLPEVATSVMASLRGQRDIAVGNVVGSNIFNILWVLGLTSTVSATPVPVAPQLWAFDLPVAAVAALACLPIFWSGLVITRWEGALFLGYYALYCVGLHRTATGTLDAEELRWIAAGFVVPLAVISVGLVWRRRLPSHSRDA